MQTTRRQALRALAAVPAAALFPLPFGCAAWKADEPLTAAGEAAAESLTTLALDLHRQLASAAGSGNVLASPWSVWTALAMLSEGARGETREQLVSAMGLDGPAGRADNVRVGARELRARLARANGRKTVSLTTADALWVSETFDVSPSSVESLREGFGAEMRSLDFANDPEAARKEIDAWVASKTNDRIKGVLSPGSVSAITELVLTDAVHFKGAWLHGFHEDYTRDGRFTKPDGTEIRVPMMHRRKDKSCPVGRVEDETAGVAATAIELNYRGDRTSFLAIVPDAHDGLPALERWLEPARLRALLGSMQDEEKKVVVPKMKLTQEVSLASPLGALGVHDVFRPDRADLSGFSESGRRDLALDDARHAAFLEIDEKGTEAAASTGWTVFGAASMPLVLNRPFLFLIRERTCGAILFLGRMTDPSA